MKEKDMLVLIKNGTFYNAYNEDAYIISYLFNYKVNKDKKCGFSNNSFNKVINTLEDKKINYEIVYKDKNPVIKKYNKLNNYKKILTKAINYQDIKIRVERIIEKKIRAI